MYRTYRSIRYRVDVVPNLPRCPVQVSVLYPPRRQQPLASALANELPPAAGSSLLANQLVLGDCAVAHECSVSRYTERTTGRYLKGCCWTGMCGCVSLRAWMRGAEASKDDVTMWRYRVDLVPNLPKCPAPVLPAIYVPSIPGTSR